MGETEAQAEIYEMARIAFERIVDDLGSVYIPQQEVGPAELTETKEQSVRFEGEDNDIAGNSADTLRFISRAHLVFGEQDLPCETGEIAYYVEEDEETETLVLYRSDRPQLEEPWEEGEGGVPLCEKLMAVNFTYYDAEGEEYESWDPFSTQGIPRLVSISLEFVSPSNPEASLKFATSVALPTNEATG